MKKDQSKTPALGRRKSPFPSRIKDPISSKKRTKQYCVFIANKQEIVEPSKNKFSPNDWFSILSWSLGIVETLSHASN